MSGTNKIPLSATDKVSLVQLMLGGPNGLASLFTSEEIGVVVGIQPIPTYAAAALAEMAAARYAAQADISSGKTKISLSQKFAQAKRMAENLRNGGAGDLPGGDGTGTSTLSMEVGGLSRSENRALDNGADKVRPNFEIGMDDNPNQVDDANDDDRFCR